MTTATLLTGDAIDRLRDLPDGIVHCCITSPPYYGLRDYAADGQIGHEATPREYVDGLVAVFREVRRVLRGDGSLWVVIGDGYAQAGGRGEQGSTSQRKGRSNVTAQEKATSQKPPPGLKPKDLIGVPWMLAFALRDDGWYLREEIVWRKSSCMPESVRDRCTRQHETVFHLTRSERYYHDAFAIAEPYAESSIERLNQPSFDTQHGGDRDYGTNGVNSNRSMRKALENMKSSGSSMRNARSVWDVNPEPFDSQRCAGCGSVYGGAGYRRLPKGERNARICGLCGSSACWESHFAVFPTRLASRILRCSTPDGGCCGACGTPLERIVEKGEPDEAWRRASGADSSGGYAGSSRDGAGTAGAQDASATKARILAGMATRRTVGWRRTCGCADDGAVRPTLALDPFSGAGTVALCAARLGRHAVGIDLNGGYNAMAVHRLRNEGAKCLDGDGARLPFAASDLVLS